MLSILQEALDRLRAELPSDEPPVDEARLREVLLAVALRMRDNFPYPHPLYAGQMLKPPHAVARLAYALAQWVNPNNHALDGGRASSAMEKELVPELARMVGFDTHLGHLTGGGTVANLEALWVGSRLHPGKTVLASEQAHYTHARLCEVLGIPFEPVPVDARGRVDVRALEARLERGDVGMVVATAGTTGLGAVDPIEEVAALRARHPFRLHVDAAYGGYYCLASNLDGDTAAALRAAAHADSLVVDPHKHGLQPYGCGAVLFRDPAVGRLYRHESPYTYFSSSALHLGEISLECSRPGAAAVALWATMEMFPLTRGGAFAQGLESCHRAARRLHASLAPRFRVGPLPELDIVVWAPRDGSAAAASARARVIFDLLARQGVHLALVQVPRALASAWWPDVAWGDAPGITCLRSCLLKHEHEAWVDRIAASVLALA
jgi:glutamate/tyrosine decarboxylase-like PLP-dependent enzyme